jgi:hypothetical protein
MSTRIYVVAHAPDRPDYLEDNTKRRAMCGYVEDDSHNEHWGVSQSVVDFQKLAAENNPMSRLEACELCLLLCLVEE